VRERERPEAQHRGKDCFIFYCEVIELEGKALGKQTERPKTQHRCKDCSPGLPLASSWS